ncbi:T9SS type B sorting domain-containing protein [Empedobacter stercoris]|uniref:T9SS type B sorting domain-containing protein n=1 Tax=Empedobacter stercoris TaxID=1628248 RepID=UPI001CE0535B|nr:T9SS type B sorting domain-containing protein [Empedobacter stercoris]MCA4781776.1 T9SS type B sorting domain-containing protein [Empedobacter stercoris]
MKKIFYFLLLMLSGVVLGQQHPLTRIDPNQLNFLNIPLTPKSVDFKTTIGCGGRNDGRSHAAMLYFKADYDLDLKFDIIGQLDGDYAVIVYKVNDTNGDGIPNEVFQTNTTITALRSIYSSHSTKSLVDNSTDFCEFYGSYGTSDGKVKSLDFEANSYIVIAIQANLAAGTNPLFDIHLNIAKTVDNLVFDNHCYTDDYLLSDVKTKIINDIRASDPSVNVGSVEFYKPNNTLTNDNISYANGIEQTLYARVYDNLGKLVYIYKPIIFKFIPEHQFNFKLTFETEYACTPTYTIPDEDELLNKLFPTVDSNYSISSIVIDGTSYTSGQNVNLAVGQTTSMKIKVHYGGGCPIDSHEVSIPLAQGKPTLSGDIYDTTCDSSYKINFDRIYSKFGKDKNAFDLIVTLDGLPISDGQPTAITTTLTYKVKIKSRTGGGCESDEVNFVVTKTQPATIVGTEIKDFCINDPAFTPTQIGMAVNRIQNGNNYNLRYYLMDGTEAQMSDLYEYLKEKMNGKIIVKALAADNGNTICDTVVELTFKLDESTFQTVSNIPTLNSSCSEVGLGHTFTISEIEAYLKSKFSRTDITFNGISDEFLTDNQSKTITFQVKINGESCWSEEMILKLQVITKPNVPNALHELKADCDDKITIDAQVLSDLFGANSIVDYHYEILYNNSKPLTFDTSGKAIVKIHFKNKLDNSCFVEKEIIINKKQDLVVDIATLETYTKDHPVIYCDGDDVNAKNQIKDILDYIQTNYSLISSKTKDQIFDQFNSNQGSVDVDFYNLDYCGVITLKLNYKKNSLPNIEVENPDPLCTGEKYKLDFTTQTDYEKYYYEVEKDGVRILGTYIFELDAGDYIITISDIDSGCPKEFSLKLTNSETPVIDKITINEKSIIVTAKGSGKLEYALFDEAGNLVVAWQTNNELIIPENITNNNFTVKVRLNNCGVVTYTNIIYLALPSFISPNNDGKNDFWKPMTKNGKINDVSNSYKLIIFDRYGKQILSKEGTNIIEWDGTHNGKPVADGTYWYMLESNEELQVLYSGYIVVKRKIN